MSWKPPTHTSVSPYLIVPDAGAVLAFLESTFGGTVLRRVDRDDGSTAHAEIRIDDSVVMMGSPEDGSAEPSHVHVYVPDVDAAYAAALAAGGVSVQAPAKADDPDRRAGVRGPGGTTWWIATQVDEA